MLTIIQSSFNIWRNLPAYILLISSLLLATPSLLHARELIKITPQDIALDISQAVELYQTNTKSIKVTTSPGSDGIVKTIEVQATTESPKHYWAVFAIVNPTNEQIDRLIVTPHYRLVGSGILHPDLGSKRILSITPSEGFALIRQNSASHDVFSITINPGAVITFVAEITSEKLMPIYLWQTDAYKSTLNSYTFYQGILLGIAGLLAVLLSVLFIVRGTFIFPAAAVFAWSALAYISVNFHFFDKIFKMTTGSEPIWRACVELSITASLLLFLCAYLNLYKWHYKLYYTIILATILSCVLLFFSIYHPAFTASLARILLGGTTFAGAIIITMLAIRGLDRAVMIIPTWLFLILWVIATYSCITAKIDNDIIEPALGGGLILLVLLIAFTILQQVFSSTVFHQGLFSDSEKRSLAMMGAGDIVWDWDVQRDQVHIKPDLTRFLGARATKLNGTINNFINSLHLDDRNKFYANLNIILDAKKGQIEQNFRIRSSDNHYHWFNLRARPFAEKDGTISHCIGTLVNITELKTAQEHLLKDSVRDNLTGLPNRQLFIDRLQSLLTLSALKKDINPSVLVLDFDGFRSINQAYGHAAGDNFLMIIAKRLNRLLKPQDTLCHLKADRFAIILVSPQNSNDVAALISTIQKAASAPVKLSNNEIKLTASIGLYSLKNKSYTAAEVLSDAQLAVSYVKHAGGNSIELFKPTMRSFNFSLDGLSKDLPKAIEREELRVIYHPILTFNDSEIVGFEAYTIWEHPQYGTLSVTDFIACAEHTSCVNDIANFTFTTIAKDLFELQERFFDKNLFITMNLFSADMLNQELINNMKSIQMRYPFDSKRFVIELSEAILLEKPEQAADLLTNLKNLDFKLALDHFGTGYSSLAYLTRYNFDFIKLDKSVLTENISKKTIFIKALINVAHELNHKVIATGVDTQEDARLLAELGCEYIQSIVFSEPLVIDKIIELIKQHN
ncbi:sensor domain-containing phosphodiesterase [Bartonella sp. TP]|uniref:sensor domain-containing phosphodiesterase n=1 Tax=Bartonella sp. TP TaxID=3057550 RepID=UPI0025AF4353|nr:sensor domain-containing phosphodiesterase [Bartonella sp. TP]WJW80186.1 EAL domain-containing protein [Bartonella sp. TP]